MEKTVLNRFIQTIESRGLPQTDEEWLDYKNMCKMALLEERQQIEEAYKKGFEDGMDIYSEFNYDYFTQKFGK